jgi:hypothetical protein
MSYIFKYHLDYPFLPVLVAADLKDFEADQYLLNTVTDTNTLMCRNLEFRFLPPTNDPQFIFRTQEGHYVLAETATWENGDTAEGLFGGEIRRQIKHHGFVRWAGTASSCATGLYFRVKDQQAMDYIFKVLPEIARSKTHVNLGKLFPEFFKAA